MNTDNKKIAFVTGSNGFVGLNLCEELLANNWRVIALHRRNSDITYLKRLAVEAVTGDILDPESLLNAMPAGVDAVFHVAGNINMWSRRNAEQTAINVDGTRNMVETALAKQARRFIFTSSISAYGLQSIPVCETTPSTAANSPINYERNKWHAEEIVRAAVKRGLSSCIINPCAIIGPKDRSSWASMLYMIRDGKLKGIPPGRLPVSHVKEVVRAHIAAVEHGGEGENYILAGEVITFEDLFRMMAECIGIELKAGVAPAIVLKIIARIQTWQARFTGTPPDLTPELAIMLCSHINCSHEKAERELGYLAVPVRTCVEDCVNWLKAEKLL